MNYQDILNQLDTLPYTFLRPGSGFASIQAAKAAALMRYAGAIDGLVRQLQFSQASGVWLDVWGKLFSIPRNIQESDGSYASRISATLVSGRATPVAMLIYLKVALGITATISEDFVHTVWQLTFQSQQVTNAQFSQLLENLSYVRPAGVPTLASVGGKGGLFLGTVNYLGNAPRTTGAYLETGTGGLDINISAYTNNSKPLLPTTYLSDPTINPGLA